ncbi:MAG: phage/plasmid primase, P4 family [Fibrobacteraceae bacterium]
MENQEVDNNFRVEQFKIFYELLTCNAPTGYTPWFFPCEKNGKNPDALAILKINPDSRGSWHHESARLNKEQAIELIKQGYNIGISARKNDKLIIGDIDNPGLINQLPHTLTTTSRKRCGGHFFGWDKDGSAKVNIPTDNGEIRSDNQYVLSCGSYVPFNLENEKDRKAFDGLTEDAKNDPYLGYYTIRNQIIPNELTFNDLPKFFREKQNENLESNLRIKQTEETKEFKGEGKYSELFKLKVSDIIGLIPEKQRFGHPLHESDTDSNFSLSKDGTLGHCWRHLVSLNAVQFLCVKVGYAKCEDAGTPHKGIGFSKLKGDKKAFEVAYNEALKLGLIKEWIAPQKNNVVIMSKFSPVPYAEKLMSDHEFLYDKHERFWIYDNNSGLWKEDADKFIKNRLRLYLLGDELQKANYCDEIVKYIQDLTWKDIDPTEDTKNLIAFNNCLFDLNTCEILNFDKKYFITNKIKIDLDENFKECSLIDKFFEELVGNENKITLYELIAYCLVRDYPYQKFWILHGIGKNGKSAYLNLIRKVIGDENISVETPQNLSSRPFSIGYLWNKLANISSDIPYTQLENLNTLKELTGNDVVGCERKYKSAFGFRNFAKLIFSGNELPQVNDKSYAFYRRVYILQFNNQIQNPDPNIIDKITTSEQLQGLAWKIIQILKDMKNRNYVFTIDPNEDEMKQLYENLSNPLNRFINECCEQNRDYSVLKFEFADAFNKWASQKGLRVWNERDVNREMAHRYSETRKPTESYDKESQSIQIKHYRAWEGLDFKKSTEITK